MRLISKICAVVVTFALCSAPAGAQSVVRPTVPVTTTSFAIFTDTPTWEECGEEIQQFARQLDSEQLPTFIVHANWKNPEQVKKLIKKLHSDSRLEGVMFAGDIPVTLIRKAQHLTSAFKMDETEPWIDSSVPSDRFYDDFSLKFDYLRPDSVHAGYFYYDLAADSPNHLHCDIYSARVKPVKGADVDASEQIRRFFRKATAQHQQANKLDQFYSHTGDGSYSNSLNAWVSEAATLREQMPGTFDSPTAPGRTRFTRYSLTDYPKDEIITQITRPDLDLTIFHEHGMPERQYISSIPSSEWTDDHVSLIREQMREQERRKAKSADGIDKLTAAWREEGFGPSWYEGYDHPNAVEQDSITDARRGIMPADITEFRPNSRMVIFDACYNGDYREDDCIASRYVFADGNTVTTFANSVNVLQDKQANEMLGLLWMGARVGQWAKLTNILESHIIGDPTYRFTSSAPGVDAAALCSMPYERERTLEWLDSPLTDMRTLAMHTLYRNDPRLAEKVCAEIFATSPKAMERYTALSILEKLGGDTYMAALPQALRDANEFIRRTTVSRMARVGDDAFVDDLIETYFYDTQAERVQFQIENNIHGFSSDAFEKAMKGRTGERADKLRKAFERQKNANESIIGDGSGDRWRKLYIKSLRNENIHATLSDYLDIATDTAAPEDVRLTMLDALAWYTTSHRKADIIEAARKVANDKKASKALRAQARRTINRLTL